jgi:TP901 family phage tail tape measure protein
LFSAGVIVADLEKTLKVIFQGENKELNAVMKSIDGQMTALKKTLDGMADPLDKAGKDVLKLDAALLSLVAGGIALAIRESSNFNKEFALISTSVDATGKDLARYRDEVLQYSTTSVKSISDINAALYTAAQAGIKWGDSLDFMSKAEQLAVANNANLNTTVDLLTGTMNAYGYSVKDVGHLNDVFFTSTLIGKQTIDQLGQSMGMVVGIAANFGVSFESLSAAISTLTAKGMETSEAITAVKGVITSMANPSAEAAKAAAELGLNFSVAELKAVGLEGMLKKVMDATGGNADKMKILFGETRALNGIMQLTGDNLTFFNDALQKINNSTGSAEAAYKKMADTFANQSQTVVNAAKAMMVEIGTRLEETAAKYAGSFALLLSGIAKGIDAGTFNGIFAIFDEFATRFAVSVGKIAASMPDIMANLDFSKLIEAMRNVGEAISNVFGDAGAEDITEAINTIIDTVASLISVSQGIIEVFIPIGVAIGEAIKAFNQLDTSTKELMGNLMGFGMAYKFFGPLSAALVALGVDAEQAGSIFTFFFAALENGFNVIKVLLYAVATGFFELIVGVNKFLDMIPGLDFSKELEQNEKVLESLKGKMSGAADDLMLSTAKVVDAWNGTGESADKAAGKVSEFQKAVEKIETSKTTELTVKTDPANLREEAKKVDAAIPAKKNIDVELNKDKVKQDADVIKTMVEWKAKIDIADIEAGVKKMETMFQSINTGITSTGNLLGSLFGTLNSASAWNADLIKGQIEKENALRQKQFALQEKLINQQMEMNELKIAKMKTGDFAIKVQADGLQAELEAFMWKILKAIQVRASASQAEFLLGI